MEARFESVSFQASARTILSNVSLDLAPGRTTVLLGPSGAGKSTLLKVAAGLVEPSAGRVLIGNEDVTERPPEARPIGIAFQEPRLFPFLGVLGNVAFPLAARGVARPEREKKAREARELASASHLVGRGVANLSGGEAQRVALARAIVHRPPVLLLDEPLSSLDTQLRRSLREDLATLVRRVAATTLLVTHDQDDAFALADQLAVLHAGKLIEAGSPEELYRRPRDPFTATFLGEGTLVPGTLTGEELDLGFVSVRAPGGGTHALIRPEDLRLARSDEARAFSVAVRAQRFAGGRRRLEVAAGDVRLAVDVAGDATIGERIALLLVREVHVLALR